MRPEYQTRPTSRAWLAASVTESVKQKELNGKNLKAALNSIKDFDTGGLIGVPSPSAATPSPWAVCTART